VTFLQCTGPWLAALVLVCGLPLAPALAQQLPPQAATNFEQAIEHLRAQRYPAAEEFLKQLVQQFPDHPDIQEALAIVLVSQGKPESATPHFEKVVKLTPESSRAHQNLGANYLRVGRVKGAEVEFQQALKLQPDNPTVHYNLGSLYLSQHRFEEALPHLRQAYEQQPTITENRHKLALCHFFLRQHQETAQLLADLNSEPDPPAEFLILQGLNYKALGEEVAAQSAFDRALRALSPSLETYEMLAEMFFQLGLYAEAVPVFERAKEGNPDSYQMAYILAVAYQGAGQLETARATAQAALQEWPTADLHNLLGHLNEELKDYLEAVRHFQRAAELEPSEGNIFDLGYEFLAHWNWEAALSAFHYGLKLHPKSGRLWLGLGTAYFGQGDYDQAMRALLEAAEPDNMVAHHLLMDVYPVSQGYTDAVQQRVGQFYQRNPDDPWANYYYGVSLGRPSDKSPSEAELADATRLLRRAIALKPDLGEAHFQLGVLLSEQGHWEQAVSALEAATQLKPDDAVAHYRLALAYQRIGKVAEAKEMLVQYRELKAEQGSKLARRDAQSVKFIHDLKK
jgi:tetratricopeptide (TPR) repeat protein